MVQYLLINRSRHAAKVFARKNWGKKDQRSIVCQIHKLALNILDNKVLITDIHAKVLRAKLLRGTDN